VFISWGRECESCKALREQLAIVNAEKKQILDTLINLAKPEVVQSLPTIVEPIAPKAMAWHKRREMLEEEDRNKAKVLRENEKLEEELGVK
jgi:hypothetical protein